MYFGLPVNVSVSLDACLSVGGILYADGKKFRSVVRVAASGYKTRLDPFGFPCGLSEMSKIQDWICLKHNAVKPQSPLFLFSFSVVEEMEGREHRVRRARQCLDLKLNGRPPKSVRKSKPS